MSKWNLSPTKDGEQHETNRQRKALISRDKSRGKKQQRQMPATPKLKFQEDDDDGKPNR